MAFPETHRSLVLAVRSADAAERERALETVVAAYWRPVYRHVRGRFRVSTEEAEDLAQGFFARALEKGWLARYEPARGRFRSYLLACLQAFVANQRRDGRRLKRGGGLMHVPLETRDADGETRELQLADKSDLEADFQREWARGLFALAVRALRERSRGTSREVAFALFERYDLEGQDAAEPPRYADLAEEFGVPVTQVTNHLHWARRELRKAVLETLRETTASEEEYRAEARALFGGEPR
ncbi:MAG TPA: sigma-70 family RNA polymerase sigma factor [Vicinamibacteria bacterium]